ncbi:MAG: hypothetical protein HY550_07060 [Elusimicrobia bacterium]|nr:hypothetical protein [Elusimicrobiota bacterium]
MSDGTAITCSFGGGYCTASPFYNAPVFDVPGGGGSRGGNGITTGAGGLSNDFGATRLAGPEQGLPTFTSHATTANKQWLEEALRRQTAIGSLRDTPVPKTTLDYERNYLKKTNPAAACAGVTGPCIGSLDKKPDLSVLGKKETPALLRSARGPPLHTVNVSGLERAPAEQPGTIEKYAREAVPADSKFFRSLNSVLKDFSGIGVPKEGEQILASLKDMKSNLQFLNDNYRSADLLSPADLKAKQALRGAIGQLDLLEKGSEKLEDIKFFSSVADLFTGKPEKFIEQATDAVAGAMKKAAGALSWMAEIPDTALKAGAGINKILEKERKGEREQYCMLKSGRANCGAWQPEKAEKALSDALNRAGKDGVFKAGAAAVVETSVEQGYGKFKEVYGKP